MYRLTPKSVVYVLLVNSHCWRASRGGPQPGPTRQLIPMPNSIATKIGCHYSFQIPWIYEALTSDRENCPSRVTLPELKYPPPKWYLYLLTADRISTENSGLLRAFRNNLFFPIKKSFTLDFIILYEDFCRMVARGKFVCLLAGIGSNVCVFMLCCFLAEFVRSLANSC